MGGVRLRPRGAGSGFLAEASTDTNDLRHGWVDLEVGSTEPVVPEIRHETVGHDRLVAALRPYHRYARGRLTVERYAQAHHVIVQNPPRPEPATERTQH